MSLPKTSHPMFDIEVPSTKKKVKMRPMLVKEEKLLLMAKTTDDPIEIMNSIKQVVNNCLIDNVDIDKFSTFDIEYMFIKLRAISINNMTKVSVNDFDDKETYEFDVELDKVQVLFPEGINNKIELDDGSVIMMRYPSSKLYSDEGLRDKIAYELDDYLIRKCIDKIYEGDTVFNAADATDEELIAYVDDLQINPYNEMRSFVKNVPKLNYVIEYKDKSGNMKKVVMSKLTDFFTLR